MRNTRDPGFVKLQESIDQRLEPAVQRAKELYNKYKAEIGDQFDTAYINLKEKAIKENKRVVLVKDILAEISNYQSFLDFCTTDEGAYALLEKDRRTYTKNTLITAMFEEIILEKPTTIKLFFGVSESLSKNALDETIRDIPTESQEEYEIAQELELRGIALALKAEMDIENSSEYSNQKRICGHENSGKITKKIKLSEDKLLKKCDSKANSDLEDGKNEEIE